MPGMPSTCTGVPPGVVTIVRPRPTVPSGLSTARPTVAPRRAAPHWSSKAVQRIQTALLDDAQRDDVAERLLPLKGA